MTDTNGPQSELNKPLPKPCKEK